MYSAGKRKKKQKGGGGGGGEMNNKNKKNDVNIAEATRIKIQTLLEDFRTSNHKGTPCLFMFIVPIQHSRLLFLLDANCVFDYSST